MQVVEAFKILTSDKQVKAILVNIFGTHWLLPDHVLSNRQLGCLLHSWPAE